MIVVVIVAVEIAFWVLLAAGLIARYPLRLPRVGAALLVCVPLVDLVLLGATVIDLRGGATAGVAHGLAAVYLGVSVGYGHRMIRWADVRFAHRFAGGPVGVDTLATAISEDALTLEDVYEPYLIQLGFIKRTPRGRVATAHAYDHLGLPVGGRDEDLSGLYTN